MLKRFAFVATLIAVVGGGAYGISPTLRVQVGRWVAEVTGQPPKPEVDPVGFTDHAAGKLQKDLVSMQGTRQELAGEVGKLTRKVHEQEALRDGGTALANAFREKYLSAKAEGAFPIAVCGRSYSETEAKTQVSLILAEVQGYEQAIAALRDVQGKAEAELEAMAVKINTTETQLVALKAKQGLIEAHRLTAEGEQLLAQVDDLVQDNAKAIADNPVGTIQELMAAAEATRKTPAKRESVEAFLAGSTVVRGQSPAEPAKPHNHKAEPQKSESQPTVGRVNPAHEGDLSEPASHSKPRPKPARQDKPVYSQF
jgi:hypothetical protein